MSQKMNFSVIVLVELLLVSVLIFGGELPAELRGPTLNFQLTNDTALMTPHPFRWMVHYYGEYDIRSLVVDVSLRGLTFTTIQLGNVCLFTNTRASCQESVYPFECTDCALVFTLKAPRDVGGEVIATQTFLVSVTPILPFEDYIEARLESETKVTVKHLSARTLMELSQDLHKAGSTLKPELGYQLLEDASRLLKMAIAFATSPQKPHRVRAQEVLDELEVLYTNPTCETQQARYTTVQSRSGWFDVARSHIPILWHIPTQSTVEDKDEDTAQLACTGESGEKTCRYTNLCFYQNSWVDTWGNHFSVYLDRFVKFDARDFEDMPPPRWATGITVFVPSWCHNWAHFAELATKFPKDRKDFIGERKISRLLLACQDAFGFDGFLSISEGFLRMGFAAENFDLPPVYNLTSHAPYPICFSEILIINEQDTRDFTLRNTEDGNMLRERAYDFCGLPPLPPTVPLTERIDRRPLRVLFLERNNNRLLLNVNELCSLAIASGFQAAVVKEEFEFCPMVAMAASANILVYKTSSIALIPIFQAPFSVSLHIFSYFGYQWFSQFAHARVHTVEYFDFNRSNVFIGAGTDANEQHWCNPEYEGRDLDSCITALGCKLYYIYSNSVVEPGRFWYYLQHAREIYGLPLQRCQVESLQLSQKSTIDMDLNSFICEPAEGCECCLQRDCQRRLLG